MPSGSGNFDSTFPVFTCDLVFEVQPTLLPHGSINTSDVAFRPHVFLVEFAVSLYALRSPLILGHAWV